MGLLDFPDFTRDDLAELGGWTVLRQARTLQKAGAVSEVGWEHPDLTGTVDDSGQQFKPVLNLRSLTFVRNSCQCRAGRAGQVCPHAVALVLAIQRQAEAPPPPPKPEPVREPVEPPGPTGPKTIKVDASGEPLEVRFWLPPNLEAAAGRNAIVLKLEFEVAGEKQSPEKLFKGRSYSLKEGLPDVLTLLEQWCGGSLYSLIQLKADQLRQVIERGGKTAVFLGKERPDGVFDPEDLGKTVLPLLKAPATTAPEVRRSREVRNRMPSRPRPSTPAREVLPENWMVIDGSPKFLSILLRERDHPQYRRCAEWLRAEGFRKEPSNGKWWLRDQHKVLNFLALNRGRLEADYDPGYTDNFKERTCVIQPVPLECETLPSGSGFSMRVALKADGLDLQAVRNALVSGRHYIVLDDRIYLLEKSVLEKFESMTRTLGGDPHLPMTGLFEAKLSAADLAHTEGLLDDLDMELELPEDWTKRSAAIREVGKLEAPPLAADLRDRFRSYQLIGTAWMWHLYRNELGGILADEMGLGKTIQAIGLILSWQAEGRGEGPVLVVSPASLLGNWQRELTTWAPGLNVYLHHGPSRLTAFDEESFHPDVCLTSYSTLRNDRDQFQTVSFSLAIADEAQHVKNRRSHASRSLRSVAARSRFVLTGTPIENSVEDLRALFDFCLPGYLKRAPSDLRGDDRQWFERQAVEKAAPYILRRSKAEVAPELPDKIEQTLWCELESRQREMYQAVREKTEQVLLQMASAGASENRLRFTILTELLRLRQVCADPGLLDPEYPLESSGKFQAFRELLSEAMDGSHRILVFSQFVKLLKRLRAWFDTEGIPTEYIDGSTRDRLAVCDRFNNNPEITVCLISLKAGGTGLNLTGADTVVHFDPWWNPAVEDQATDRAHRIGQSRTVTSYKLVTEGTVEDKVLALQLKKAGLLQDLLDESAIHSAKVDLSTLKSLLS
jgi:superfamily II DNA or RNA helicase